MSWATKLRPGSGVAAAGGALEPVTRRSSATLVLKMDRDARAATTYRRRQ
jgi:hypothetical protein